MTESSNCLAIRFSNLLVLGLTEQCLQTYFIRPFHPTMMVDEMSATMFLRKHTNTSLFVTTIPSHAHGYIWQEYKSLGKSRLGLRAPSYIPHKYEIPAKSPGDIPRLKARKYHLPHLTNISINSGTVWSLTFDRFLLLSSICDYLDEGIRPIILVWHMINGPLRCYKRQSSTALKLNMELHLIKSVRQLNKNTTYLSVREQ